MIQAELVDRRGDYVATVPLPPFRTLPEILHRDSRYFVLDRDWSMAEPRYVEALCWPLLDGIDAYFEGKGAPR
jgi:hypothetical protein